ncbi:MAG: DUF2079 domain-containing protein [bacterium]|nr:DUF2079 domain-containing protein [bacterium]
MKKIKGEGAIKKRKEGVSFISLLLLLLEALSLGLFGWEIRYPDLLKPFIFQNRAPLLFKEELVSTSISFFLVGLLLIGGACFLFRKKGLALILNKLSLYLLPFLTLFCLPLFRIDFIEYEHPFLIIFLVIFVVSILFIFGRFILKNHSLPQLFSPRISLSVLIIFVLSYLFYFGYLSILRYHRFFAETYDLTWEHQVMWGIVNLGYLHSSIGDFTGNYLQAHTPFIYYLLAPFYFLHQSPESLLVIQTLFLGCGAIPLYFLALRKLNNHFCSLVISLSYLLHPAIAGINLYDFHSSPLGIPLFFLALYFLEVGKDKLFLCFLLLVGSTREDMIPLIAATGIYLILIKRRIKFGLFVTIAGGALFYLVTAIVMKHYGGGGNFSRFNLYFDEHQSIISLLKTLIFNPIYSLQQLLTAKKIEFLLIFFLPSSFLCLLSGWGIILLSVGLFSTILSYHIPHYTVGYQYGSALIAAIYILSIEGTRSLKQHFSLSLLGLLILLTSLFSNYLYGSFFSKTIGWEFCMKKSTVLKGYEGDVHYYNNWVSRYKRIPEPTYPKKTVAKIKSLIPRRVPLSACYYIGPHFSDREKIYLLPKVADAQFIIADRSYNSIPFGKDNHEWEVIWEEGSLIALKRR